MDAQRYKVGYYTDEWEMSSNTPCLLKDDNGYAVKYEDYEQLRARVLELEEAAQDVQTLSAECFSLYERIAELEKERDAAREEVEATRCDLNMVLRESARLREENTAAQLVIQQMREALQILDRVSNMSCGKVQEALSLQPSTEALDAYVAEAVKKEREACAENATAWAQANRLALELECLLLDTKDNAIVSKWWDSGMAALDEYQQLKPGAAESAEAWAKMRKEML